MNLSRGRPRDSDADRRILQAARQALLTAGYAGLAIDEVAQRAGVAKTTLYRRWPTKDHLAIAVYADMLDRDVPVTDTGDVRADLGAYLKQIAAALDSVRRAGRPAHDGDPSAGIVAELVAAAARHADVGQAMRGLYARRIRLAVELVERATQRGELRADTDPVLLLDQLAGALYYRVLITGAPVDDSYLERLVGAALDGAMSTKEQR
ncbi:TetR/AcrR family transcriptional regulator [Amycolatopsis kentuckyensis]|uniref:TetR/AcrR family transcriptional regulator n=1 Tax=Amycolatopsis kentuckyensis TaxID=218823 RepID=UPI000A36E100|nr:TetR/AcrR family transcriptional regulator [Amycolatopsis kentuckyensis]